MDDNEDNDDFGDDVVYEWVPGGPRRLLAWICRILLIGPVLVLVGWLIGRIVSDRTEWGQWLLWMPTVFVVMVWGLVLPLMYGAWYRGRARRIAIVLTFALAMAHVAHLLFVEHRFARTPIEDPVAIGIFHWTAGVNTAADAAQIARMLEADNPHVAFTTNAGGTLASHHVRDAWLGEGKTTLRKHPFSIASRVPVRTWRRGVWMYDELIFVTLVEIDVHETDAGRAAGFGDAFAEQPLTIWLIDLPSDTKRPRHLIADQVLDAIASAGDGLPAADIVVGDFNMTRGSASLARIFPGYRNAFDEAGHGWGATFPGNRPLFHLDQMLVGPRVRCVRYDVLAPEVPRHRPQLGWFVGAE